MFLFTEEKLVTTGSDRARVDTLIYWRRYAPSDLDLSKLASARDESVDRYRWIRSPVYAIRIYAGFLA